MILSTGYKCYKSECLPLSSIGNGIAAAAIYTICLSVDTAFDSQCVLSDPTPRLSLSTKICAWAFLCTHTFIKIGGCEQPMSLYCFNALDTWLMVCRCCFCCCGRCYWYRCWLLLLRYLSWLLPFCVRVRSIKAICLTVKFNNFLPTVECILYYITFVFM